MTNQYSGGFLRDETGAVVSVGSGGGGEVTALQLATEVARAQAAEAAEVTARATADTTEVTRATAAEGTIQSLAAAAQAAASAANTALINRTILSGKGSLISALSAGTPVNIPVGADGQVLTANSGVPEGASWTTPSAAAAGSAYLEHSVATGSALGATSLVIDRAPFFGAKIAKIAIGIGTVNCEIREVTAVASATLTLNTGLYYTHALNEPVIFFTSSAVPLVWWGARGGDSSIDSNLNIQAATRAVGKVQSNGGAPLIIDGQLRDYYSSGPFCLTTSTGFHNCRVFAKISGSGYLGPMDGPVNGTYETNAFLSVSQNIIRWSYDSASNIFTCYAADGVTLANHSLNAGYRIAFDSTGVPTGLVAGRQYRVQSIPTTSTFKIEQKVGTGALSFASDGIGWAHVQVGDNNKAFFRKLQLDGNNIGQKTFTAVAATDVFTSTAHGFTDGTEVRINLNGTLPGGIGSGLETYFVRDSTTNTYKLALTAGGTAIDVTSDGAGFAISVHSALNGAILGLQQPSSLEGLRLDNFKGFGARVQTQQSYWENLEIINCGTGLEIGGEAPGALEIGEFVWISGVDIEQSDTRSVLIRSGKNINIKNWHIEDTDVGSRRIFDIQNTVSLLDIEGGWITAGSGAKTVIHVECGAVTGTSYQIRGLNGTFPSATGLKAIEDRDRGISLDMWDDFSGLGWANFETYSTSPSASKTDPQPYSWYGIDGASEVWGAQKASLPYRIVRHGAFKTGDMVQYKAGWTALSGTITIDTVTDIFTTSVAHGLTDGQEIHVYTGSALPTLGNTDGTFYVNSTIYRAVVLSGTTFQIRHTPSGSILNFVTVGSSTNWQIRKPPPVALRINKDGRIIDAHRTVAADADLNASEFTLSLDDTPGASLLRIKAKDSGGTVRTATVALA